ncbi:hypothetical protein CPB83DRAFT_831235 [Crepidotus variabilis]|uniref:Uncharacterized protein n=1 Tax=Crepidotus variabilis TaxID=179855 RepID=A0A9P6ETU6_9AGAR|nr:hypothetical protein CPB83DRAFT_831235 [Crepidotus variabilis]
MSGSPTPSPSKPKWSSRMGGALRRTSTLLTIARPGTPSEDREDSGSDTKSLKSVRKSSSRGSLRSIKNALSPAAHAVSSPSPIAESPMREAAAQQTEIIGPSPLAKAATNSTTYEGSTEPTKVEEAPATSPGEQSSPSGYVPPPVVSSTAGNPGAFTDDLDDLPQSQAVVDPYATLAEETTAPEPEHAAPANEEPSKPVEEEPSKAVEAPVMEPSTSYFDKPIAESMTSADSPPAHHTVVTPEFAEVAQVIPVAVVPVETTEPAPEGEAASYYRGDSDAPAPEPHHEETKPTAPVTQPQPQSQTERSVAPSAPTFGAAVMPSYDNPSYNVWAGSNPAAAVPIVMPVPVIAEQYSHQSEASSLKLPNPHAETNSDPFADPSAGPAIAVMPAPQIHAPEVSHQHQQMPTENREQAHPVIIMPLPAFDDVVARNASTQTLAGSRIPPETNFSERMPLLARPTTPKYLSTNLTSTHAPTAISPIVGTSMMYTNGHTRPRLIDLGWVEYTLPDGSMYYSHLTRKITTDLDLRRDRNLTAVTLWMDDRENESMNVDLEGWLRRAPAKSKKSSWGSKGKKDDEPIVLERYWVDHHHRSVEKEDTGDRRFVGYGRNHGHTNGNGHSHSGKGKDKKPAKIHEDQLDLEYRYWAFMESHPAHLPVSHKAKAEALDVLTWALTDQILPSNSTVPPPFGQDECQELRGVLNSFTRESEHGDNGIQTRIISRILLRVAQWRQTYFRPNKPLPLDVGSRYPSLPNQRRPFQRAVFDFFVLCLCLGIPYFFMERARLAGSRADEESGLFRGPASMLLVGAFACIISRGIIVLVGKAAIILSASVTFLSLSGLDGVTRTTGMVAILFAAFAMAATGVAILRHKADLERSVSRRRTIALSLPLVFLAYSVIAFIAGITLYSFRGKTFDDKLPRDTFEDYTRWTVVGVLGGLLGIVTTSLLVLRR